MQIELTGPAKQLVEKWLAEGRFESAEAAVEFAIEFFEMFQPDIETLRAKIQEGMDDIATGRLIRCESDGDLKAFINDVKRRGRERLAARIKPEIDA